MGALRQDFNRELERRAPATTGGRHPKPANEHFAREAGALRLATFDAGNLADALAGEHYENTKMYVRFRRPGRAGR